MGRHRVGIRTFETGYRDGPRWPDPYFCEWSVVVGDRVRRLRNDRDLTLADMSRLVPKPNEGSYSPGYFSRLERGWASSPLYVYIVLAAVFEVAPGRLLGPDDVQRAVTEGELTLVRLLRRLGMPVDEAIARLAASRVHTAEGVKLGHEGGTPEPDDAGLERTAWERHLPEGPAT